MKKVRDLCFIALIYAAAFAVGYFACKWIDQVILRYFVFDVVATVVTFIFSTVLKNSSVYDAYWSFTPLVMAIWLFVESKAFSWMQLVFLAAFCVWAVRLTVNWITVFTDFSYEDWRYRKYRNETKKNFWPIVNFWGIHMIPTLVVFAGMLPLFVIVKTESGVWSLIGVLVMLTGVLFELLADTEMHRFLRETKEKKVCRLGIWNYSRHPNYLGEITFWCGVYLAMIVYAGAYWYLIIGCVSVAVLFNVVSIPLMETRQLSRRPDYAAYQEETSRLLLLPHKKQA